MIVLAITCLCYFKVKTLAQSTNPPDLALTQLKNTIRQKVDSLKGLPVGIVMVDANGPVWVEAMGKGNLEGGKDVNDQTMFRLGLVPKMFTGLAALKLVEKGQLNLQDKFSRWAPDIAYDNPWEDTAPIRVVHLLEHTSGWDEMHFF